MPRPTDDLDAALAFHARTRHRPGRYAPGPDGLDWANQPDPFRRFEGAPSVLLPFARPLAPAPFDALGGPVAPAALALDGLSRMLELSLAISAWKAHRATRWALRCNPSSGNLHPTEAYLVLPAVEGLGGPGVYHYRSVDHALERRCALPRALTDGSFLVGLSSVHWREAWKYGERAFRYCQHDVGHSVAAVGYACAALGWTARALAAPSDDDVAALLGLDRDDDFADAEREHPDVLLLVTRPPEGAALDADWPDADTVARVRGARWSGRANRLSPEHRRWTAIDEVAAATRKARGVVAPPRAAPALPPPVARPAGGRPSVERVIRERRSAQAFDGVTVVEREWFVAALDRLLPRAGSVPFGALAGDADVHLLLFVHRVRGLAPGLYALVRDPRDRDRLAAAMDRGLEWSRLDDAPEHLPLYRLSTGDLQHLAHALSCHQDIAADAAFSLAMLAPVDEALRREGAWWYRRLHWECGLVGQAIYLEAEAAGLRATGIGCFFDDLVRDLVGLAPGTWHSLYHFAVGAPVDDARLTTLPAYDRA